MEPTNRSTYKRQNMSAEFTNSCLGKIIILAVIAVILLIVAISTVPSDEEMRVQMEDNIRECIQDNYEKRCDPVDEVFNNIRRPFTEADTTFNDKEILEIFNRNNRIEVNRHMLFSICRLYNNVHTDGLLEGIGIFSIIIPFLNYDDFVMTEGNVRGKNNDRIMKDTAIPEMEDLESRRLKLVII